MTKSFNPYLIPITATEKAIKDRKAKIAAQEELERMAMDLEARTKMAVETGRLEAEVIMQTGAKKKAAEKKLKALSDKMTKVRNAFDGNGSKLTLKWHREIINLEDALRNLKRLKEQWDQRESYL
jgi:tRNA(Phe) wybutosine-synthesizing methylase Tyw3